MQLSVTGNGFWRNFDWKLSVGEKRGYLCTGILLRPNPAMRDVLWKRKQTLLIAVARCVSRGTTQVPLLCGPSTAVFSTVQERWLMKYLMNLGCVPQRNTQRWSRTQLSGYKLEIGMKTARKSSTTDCLRCIKFLPWDENRILDYLGMMNLQNATWSICCHRRRGNLCQYEKETLRYRLSSWMVF